MSEALDLFSQEPAQSPFDAIKNTDSRGNEWWSARDLMPLLGYESYRRMADAVDRAKATAYNQGLSETELFAAAVKKSSGGRPAEDVHLARFAAYLVAMNGDPRKPEVAAAQSYFAVRTREAEVNEARALPKSDDERVLEAMQILSARVQEAQAKVLELTPKANAWDEFLSAEGDVSVNEASKALSRNTPWRIGENGLWDLLYASKWIYRDARSRPRAYQAQVNLDRLAERAQTFLDPRTGDPRQATPQVRVRAKGLDALRRILDEQHRRKAIA